MCHASACNEIVRSRESNRDKCSWRIESKFPGWGHHGPQGSHQSAWVHRITSTQGTQRHSVLTARFAPALGMLILTLFSEGLGLKYAKKNY